MLTLKDYHKMVWDLFPYGLAWPRKQGVLDKLVDGIASELSNAEERKAQLISEMDPRSSNEMFNEWESLWGLPDECSPDDITLFRRRGALISKITGIGDMRPAYYLGIAYELGYDAELFEWRPVVCGLTECGNEYMLGNDSVRYTWDLILYGISSKYFECGTAVCSDFLGSWTDSAELECRINRAKPAHTKVFFLYREARILDYYFECGISRCGDPLGC